MAELTIIIPARNEKLSIAETIKKLVEQVKADYEILVVNDHSSDSTKEVVLRLAEQNKNIKVIDNESQPSFVNALSCGIKYIKTPFFVPVMADLCDEPQTINVMYEKIKDGYDIVVGSRYIAGGKRAGGSNLKAFFSRFMGRSLYFLIGIPTQDIPNAFKMYRRDILKDISIESRGFEVSAEIPLKAYFKGARITEVPTVWRERQAGASHFKMLKTGPGYFRLYLWAIFKRLCLLKTGS